MYTNAPSRHPKPSAKLKRSGSIRRLRLLTLFMLCFIGWAGLKLWDQYGEVQAKMSALAQLEDKLEQTKALNEQYKLEIIRLNDLEYIEQLLRGELHMTKEGETLFIETE